MNAADKIYALEFENKVLKGILFENNLERWVPGCSHPVTEKEHLSRYNWVSTFCKNKSVLDVACGTGMGSQIIATKGKAKKVVGLDIDKYAVKYAKIKYKVENIKYLVADAQKLFPTTQKFDLAVSFETIEHLNHPEKFLANLKQSLNTGGTLFISTPISKNVTNHNPENIFHKIEWNSHDFLNLLSHNFEIVTVYYQNSSEQKLSFLRKHFKFLYSKQNYIEKYKIYPESFFNGSADYQIVEAIKK